MTKQEMLALPAGRKLDAMIAEKVMGWYVSSGGLCDSKRRPDEVFIGDTCEIIPSFSTHMADAWKVFLKLPQMADGFPVLGRYRENWYVDFGSWIPIVRADTPALTICKAALMLALEGKLSCPSPS